MLYAVLLCGMLKQVLIWLEDLTLLYLQLSCLKGLLMWTLLFSVMGLLASSELRLKFRIFHEVAVQAHNKTVDPIAVAQLAEAKKRILEAERSPHMMPMNRLQTNLLEICDMIKRNPCEIWQPDSCPSWRPGCYNRPPAKICPPWIPSCKVPIPPKTCWYKQRLVLSIK